MFIPSVSEDLLCYKCALHTALNSIALTLSLTLKVWRRLHAAPDLSSTVAARISLPPTVAARISLPPTVSARIFLSSDRGGAHLPSSDRGGAHLLLLRPCRRASSSPPTVAARTRSLLHPGRSRRLICSWRAHGVSIRGRRGRLRTPAARSKGNTSICDRPSCRRTRVVVIVLLRFSSIGHS